MSGKVYSLRPKDSGAGEYIEAVSEETGMSRTDILERCVVLAREANLFEEERSQNPSQDETPVDDSSEDSESDTDVSADRGESDVARGEASRSGSSGGGRTAADVARQKRGERAGEPARPSSEEDEDHDDDRAEGAGFTFLGIHFTP